MPTTAAEINKSPNKSYAIVLLSEVYSGSKANVGLLENPIQAIRKLLTEKKASAEDILLLYKPLKAELSNYGHNLNSPSQLALIYLKGAAENATHNSDSRFRSKELTSSAETLLKTIDLMLGNPEDFEDLELPDSSIFEEDTTIEEEHKDRDANLVARIAYLESRLLEEGGKVDELSNKLNAEKASASRLRNENKDLKEEIQLLKREVKGLTEKQINPKKTLEPDELARTARLQHSFFAQAELIQNFSSPGSEGHKPGSRDAAIIAKLKMP